MFGEGGEAIFHSATQYRHARLATDGDVVMFDLLEDRFDRVQLQAVRRQKVQVNPFPVQHLPYDLDLLAGVDLGVLRLVLD